MYFNLKNRNFQEKINAYFLHAANYSYLCIMVKLKDNFIDLKSFYCIELLSVLPNFWQD